MNVRVWNLESDHDTKAAEFLENELLGFRELGDLAIRTTGRSALRKCHKKGTPLKESLRRAIQYFLAQDDYIIFIIDSDQQESSPLMDQLKGIVKDCDFSDRVFFASEIQEEKLSIPAQWQDIVSDFRVEVESERKQFRDKWDSTISHFHEAFADIPEEEVIRDFEEALAEVRRERA